MLTENPGHAQKIKLYHRKASTEATKSVRATKSNEATKGAKTTKSV